MSSYAAESELALQAARRAADRLLLAGKTRPIEEFFAKRAARARKRARRPGA